MAAISKKEVIEAAKRCSEGKSCEGCPFDTEGDDGDCILQLLRNVLVLLKGADSK